MRIFLISLNFYFIIFSAQASDVNNLNKKINNLNPQLQWSRSISPTIKTNPKNTDSIQDANKEFNSILKKPDTENGLLSTVNQHPVQKWTIQLSDKTLYRTMRRWAQEADFQLLWQIEKDYPIEANVEFNTHLRGALEQVMAGVALTDYPIQAIYNPTGRVLRVVRHLDDGRR